MSPFKMSRFRAAWNKEHIKEFGGRYASLGPTPGTSGTSRPDFCLIPHGLDRMSTGQTGHFFWPNAAARRCIRVRLAHSSLGRLHLPNFKICTWGLSSSGGVSTPPVSQVCPSGVAIRMDWPQATQETLYATKTEKSHEKYQKIVFEQFVGTTQ